MGKIKAKIFSEEKEARLGGWAYSDTCLVVKVRRKTS